MRTLALLSVVLLVAACKERPEPGGPPAAVPASGRVPARPPVEGRLVVIAELADIPGQFPANELYNYAYVMRYKVRKVLRGTYADGEILVAHYNPRLARDEIKDEQDAKVGGDVTSFRTGDAHYLVLDPLDGVWTGAVEDEYVGDKRPRWWALWAARAE